MVLLAWIFVGFAALRAQPGYATNHILIQFKTEARQRLADGNLTDQLSALLRELRLPAGAELREPAMVHLQRHARKKSLSLAHERIDLNRFLYLRLPPGLGVTECLRRLEKHPLLEYTEPDWIGTIAETIPNDPSFSDQWHHQNFMKPGACIQTPHAWEITRGSTNVLVAIMDSGLADLPEFTGRTAPGYNFAYTNSNTLDDNGHGTQVTAVLAANANNATLGAGVDWNCRIMPIKVFDSANQGLYSSWAQGIDFAVSKGCKIINLSGSGTEFSRTVQRAITNAIAQGVIFVTSAGNQGETNLGFPGYLTACITVGATDREDQRASFSNSGPQLDLVAPGADIITVGRFGDLESVRGTSFSTPMVAGVCALLAAVRPGLNQNEARQFLCAGAEDQVGDATDTQGFDNYHGWGRLNAFNSLLLATTQIDQPRIMGGQIKLSWISPMNASNKRPFQVEYKKLLTDAWIPLTNANAFRYETHFTSWIDDGFQTGEPGDTIFYRVGVRAP